MFASLLLLVVLLAQAPASSATPDIDIVRAHYATAAYEEALAHIGRLDPSAVTPELERYRALCLMALGRPEEGTLAFERLVRQAPTYDIPESELSPRMLTAFRDVRQRVLPLVIRDAYERARTHLDEKRYDTAVVELGQVLSLIDTVSATGHAATFADLRQLADGFLRLAQAEQELARRAAALAEQAAAAEAAAAEAAVEPPSPANLIVERIVVYTRDDRDVVPPVELSRFMPPWNPPAALRHAAYRGELEVVVDEAGRAEDARMLQPTHPVYDVALIAATSSWRFEPARRNGDPVKYRLTFDVALTPPER